MTRLRDRLSAERGFTLVEVVVAAAIGSVIMLVTFMLLDSSVQQTSRVGDRLDSTQRGRTAMETITRELRSQVCFTPVGQTTGTSLAPGTDDRQVVFYAFTGSTPFRPDQRTIKWDTNNNTITEAIAPGVGTPVTGFGTAGTPRTILTDATPVPKAPPNQLQTQPIFTYYPTIGNTPLAVPLSATDLGKVGRIVMLFRVAPNKRPSSTQYTDLQSQIFVRTADPNGLNGTTDPQCD